MAKKVGEQIVEQKQSDVITEKKRVEDLRKFKKFARDYRVRQEVLWYELQLLRDGDHYKIVNQASATSSGEIKVLPVQKRRGELRRTINKFRSLLRSIKTFTTLTKVRWEVPGDTEEAKTASRYLNWYGERFDTFQEVIKEVLEYGFLRSVGYFDVYWHNDKKMPWMASRDPFDLLADPNSRFMVRMYRKSKQDLKEEKDENGEKVFKGIDDKFETTKNLSSSEIFNNYLSMKYNLSTVQHSDLDEVMLEEYHIMERDEKGKLYVNITTVPEKEDRIIRTDKDDDDEFRFIPYWPEKRPNDIYNEPWMKDAMDPQKTMNNIFTHLEEYIRTMNKGRLSKHKDTEVTRFTDKDGQIIEWDGPEAPEYLQIATMTRDPFEVYNIAERTMEDLVGIHPSEIRKTETASGIRSLIAHDENNISEPFENLKTSLKQVAKRILKLSVKHMMASEDIFWWEKGKMVEGKVISEKATNKPDKVGLLKAFKNINVELVPTGAFAALMRRINLYELYEAGVLKDPRTILEGGGYGNVEEIMEREKQFRSEEQIMEAAKAKQAGGEPAVDQGAAPREELGKAVSDIKETLGG